ncbi:FIST signal transduction protein [Hyalangium versicolor]|uniref:FIST signal transduction protein n=1 Tax=Hyalangium versicolor TaxID=2861190 RepID=UPI001CCACD3E|nr:FIST N-terminal domain-containing protein [Hyalangium versicolor]
MTLCIGVGVGDQSDAVLAVRSAVEQARAQLGRTPPLAAYITCTVDHDAAQVHAAFKSALGEVALHGVTTSLGVLTPEGVLNPGSGAVAVMLFGGEPGAVFAASSLEKDGRQAGEAAAKALVQQAGGKQPRLILFNASPGLEEDMLQGLEKVCPGVPCQGGSAADHAIAGQWRVFTREGVALEGVSLLGFFGEVKLGTALSTPYAPTGIRAKATGAEGRSLKTLDGQPASQVLGGWLGDAIQRQVRMGGNILAQTALRPIAVRRTAGKKDHYVTVHPAQIHAEAGTVDVFARIEPGDEVCLMSSSPEALVSEVAHLIDVALEQGNLTTRDVKGATLIFCAGCAGALGNRINEGLRSFHRLLPGVPMLGLCTFGEQGYIPELGNVHQDLSLCLTLFA